MIKREDIDAVRAATRIEDIVGQHVTLRTAGVGSLKGLCPFHDEKTPSFHVRPALGLWHCFGCDEGGDVFSFVQRINHLSFTETVEMLAERCGVSLHFEDGKPGARSGMEPGRRQRLLDAHRMAEEFYRQQLLTGAAAAARDFLAARDFGPDICGVFGVGYAPSGWDELLRHLRSKNFTDAELVMAGLAAEGSRGIYDRFRNRLMWPIRDLTGATVGFGARRLDEDEKSPKYLNTPETPIYKKSQVLYGVDIAKKAIATTRRCVIVEGYTDVMAAHLAGVTTAVATCGTAFGDEHARIVRRLVGATTDVASGVLLSSGTVRGGEVVFTFDGDEAGRKAALRAFATDQTFAAQTFVAVEASGLDPCDLRLQKGDQAIVDLVASREPLFAFVIRSLLAQFDLSTVEGRVHGLRATAPIVAQIRDRALRHGYTRQLAGWLAVDESEVRGAVGSAMKAPIGGGSGGGSSGGVRRAGTRYVDDAEAPPDDFGGSAGSGGSGCRAAGAVGVPVGVPRGALEDPVVRVEREALEALLQYPQFLADSSFDALDSDVFTQPAYRAVADAVKAAGGLAQFHTLVAQAQGAGLADPVAVAAQKWAVEVRSWAGEHMVPVLTQLAVAPLPQDKDDGMESYAQGVVKALVRMALTRQVGKLRSALQRTKPEEDGYKELFEKLLNVEQQRRSLEPDW